MKPFVLVATKGRPYAATLLLDYLVRQTLQPAFTVVVGTSEADIAGVADHPLVGSSRAAALISPVAGLPYQRNFGLDALRTRGAFGDAIGRFFCVFFDDDFRMADDWLERAVERFARNDIVGLTGRLLADGANRGGYSEDAAISMIRGERPPELTSAGAVEADAPGAYGCNMAFVDTVIRSVRFDDAVPLYAWLEDRDYTGAARRYGRVIYFPRCVGVHLGSQDGGRSSGLRFGYSQIANPIHYAQKGTMSVPHCLRFTVQALVSNFIFTATMRKRVDYPGRLRGNLLACVDLARLRLHPRNILTLQAKG